MKKLEEMTKKELYELARSLSIKGRSKMKKAELLSAVKEALGSKEEVFIKSIPQKPSYTVAPEPLQEVKFQKSEGTALPKQETEFVKVLPVNPGVSFITWNLKSSDGKRYAIRAFIERRLLGIFDINLSWDGYYLKVRAPFKKLKVELGYIENGHFFSLLSSNEVTLPSDQAYSSDSSLTPPWSGEVGGGMSGVKA